MTRDKEKCPLSALTGVCIKQVDFIDSLNNNFLSYTAFITKYNRKKNYLEYYKVVFAIEKNVPPIKTSLLWKKPLKTCSLSRKFAERFNRRSLSKEILSRQWKARGSGLLEIFFQVYKWTGKTPISYHLYALRKHSREYSNLNFTHRRIATNDFLLETGKKETDSCAFCADSPEDDKIISTYFKNNNVRFKSRNSIKVVLAKFLHRRLRD